MSGQAFMVSRETGVFVGDDHVCGRGAVIYRKCAEGFYGGLAQVAGVSRVAVQNCNFHWHLRRLLR